MAAQNVLGTSGPFKKGKKPGETLEKFESYVKRAKLVFTTAVIITNAKKNSMIQIWGGDDMMLLYEQISKRKDTDNDDAIDKIKKELQVILWNIPKQ